MSYQSNISWTDATANFWVGCTKVSEGCKYCYMFRDYGARYGNDATKVTRTKKATFDAPLHWKTPRKIFTCSWSDFFIPDADAFRADAWDIIRRTPWHTWQILTKRPERIIECLPDDWGNGWPNVWIGVSVENQQRADERLPILLQVPAAVRFISAEPLLSPVDVCSYLQTGGIHWVIMGGESGNESGQWKYRECKMEWMIDLVVQCQKYGIPAFVKQMGTYIAKSTAMKTKHGTDIADFPECLKVQLFPFDAFKSFDGMGILGILNAIDSDIKRTNMDAILGKFNDQPKMPPGVFDPGDTYETGDDITGMLQPPVDKSNINQSNPI